jgi:ketosteroid isomerase-like protein
LARPYYRCDTIGPVGGPASQRLRRIDTPFPANRPTRSRGELAAEHRDRSSCDRRLEPQEPRHDARPLDPKIEYVNDPAAIEPGIRRGRAGLAAVLRAQWEGLPSARQELERVHARGDEVLTVTRLSRSMPGSDARLENRMLMSWMIRDRRVIRVAVLAPDLPLTRRSRQPGWGVTARESERLATRRLCGSTSRQRIRVPNVTPFWPPSIGA